MHYIVGLGNPGKQYEGTRHNVGRDLLLQLAENEGWGSWERSKNANALYLHGTLAGAPVEFVLPETFMNRSGETVTYLKKKHDAKPEELIVIYDDVDLPVGEVKIAKGRGAGGHNGIESVINALGSKDFVRVRIGVAPKSFWSGKTLRPAGEKLSRHVLGNFGITEKGKVAESFKTANAALEAIVRDGPETAMNAIN